MDKISTKNIIIVLVAAVVVIAVIFGAAAYNRYKNAQTASAEGGVTAEEKAERDGHGETNSFFFANDGAEVYEGGTYLIGEEMAAGEYVLVPQGDEGSFEIVSDLSAEHSSLLGSGSYNTRAYVTVEEGQYLKFDGLAAAVNDTRAYDNSIYQHTGMYLVGKDIEPLQYLVLLDTEDGSDGYIEVMKDSKWTADSVTESYVVDEDMTISLEEGTYVRLVGVKLREPY